MVEDNFSIAFMFSTIYLRLEGKVPASPQEIEIGLNMNATEKKIIAIEVNKCILQSTPHLSSTLFYA